MAKATKDYEKGLLERLKDPEYAAGYLNAVLEDEDRGVEERFLLALRDVARAHGMTRLSRKSRLNRQNIYKIFSRGGNPELKTLAALLRALGFKFTIKLSQRAS